jgi:hypothetical protein
MPDSLIAQLINGVWDDISQAVTEGLGRGSQKNLSDVMPIDQKKLNVAEWQDSAADPLGGGTSQVRSPVGSPATMDFLHQYPLDYDALRAPQLDAITGEIKAWAAAVRLLELSRVLDHLVSVASPHRCSPSNLRPVTVGGWGQPRYVSFTPVPDAVAAPDLAAIGWDGPISVDMPPSAPDLARALVFRVGGGPYVHRPDDLALNWVPAGDIGVSLVLAEQLQIVAASADTVAGVVLVRA